MSTGIEPHNEKPASVWNSGGGGYNDISHGRHSQAEPAACGS
jgi:hypothetical protein